MDIRSYGHNLVLSEDHIRSITDICIHVNQTMRGATSSFRLGVFLSFDSLMCFIRGIFIILLLLALCLSFLM